MLILKQRKVQVKKEWLSEHPTILQIILKCDEAYSGSINSVHLKILEETIMKWKISSFEPLQNKKKCFLAEYKRSFEKILLLSPSDYSEILTPTPAQSQAPEGGSLDVRVIVCLHALQKEISMGYELTHRLSLMLEAMAQDNSDDHQKQTISTYDGKLKVVIERSTLGELRHFRMRDRTEYQRISLADIARGLLEQSRKQKFNAGSQQIQTALVSNEETKAQKFWSLLEKYYHLTAVPIGLNPSSIYFET